MGIGTKRPLDEGHERLKAILDELRRATERINAAIKRHDDHFASEMERALRGES